MQKFIYERGLKVSSIVQVKYEYLGRIMEDNHTAIMWYWWGNKLLVYFMRDTRAKRDHLEYFDTHYEDTQIFSDSIIYLIIQENVYILVQVKH